MASPLIAHLAIPDSISVWAQTPSFPNIGEASEGRATPVGAIAMSDGDEIEGLELCNPCPGQRFVIETNVLSRNFIAAQLNPSRLNEDTATMFKTSQVKIMVSSCAWPSRRIIDPGYPIVVGGDRARVAVLAPSIAVDLQRGLGKTLAGGTPVLEEAFEVMIFARSCPLPCWTPPDPQLTYYAAHDAAAGAAQRTFIIPRGARKLWLASQDLTPNTIEWWQGDPNTATSIRIGIEFFNSFTGTSTDYVPIVGSPTHMLLAPQPVNAGVFLMRWEIGP